MVAFWFTEYHDDEPQWQRVLKDPLTIGSLVGCYLYFVLRSGPAFMRDRKPFELRTTILCYNAAQVLINVYICYAAARAIYNSRTAPGTCWMCVLGDRESYNVSCLYVANKYMDLIDSVLFVLRKKTANISFLHVFHHVAMVVWPALTLHIPLLMGECVVGGIWNGVVHVLMYSYYFGTMWGDPLRPMTQWIKKHITQVQLVQFVVLMAVFGRGTFGVCEYVWVNSAFSFALNAVFFVLFAQLYVKSYCKKGAQTTNGALARADKIK